MSVLSPGRLELEVKPNGQTRNSLTKFAMNAMKMPTNPVDGLANTPGDHTAEKLPALPPPTPATVGKAGMTPTMTPGIELPRLISLNSRLADSEGEERGRRVGSLPRPTRSVTRFSPTRSLRSNPDEKPKKFNPEPMPYRAQSFKSSTVVKKVPVLRRHGDAWSSPDYSFHRSRGIVFHADRYQWDDSRQSVCDDMSQRDRLETELTFMEKMKDFRRSQITVPHRRQHDMLMGGQKIVFCEREDVSSELQRLKSVVLPVKARDLYVGRGIRLPASHAVNKPRAAAPAPKSLKQMPLVSKSSSRQEDQPPPSELANSQSPRERQEESSSLEVKDVNRPESEMDIVMSSDVKKEDIGDAEPPQMEPQDPASQAENLSPRKAKTPNPLKATDVALPVKSEEYDALRSTFKRLDTDMDGHVTFHQLKSQLPKTLNPSQERFIKQVYDLTSASTFFGLKEFVSLSLLCEHISKLQGVVKEAYQKLDFASLELSLVHYVELYDTADSQQQNFISLEALARILTTTTKKDVLNDPELLEQLKTDIDKTDSHQIQKIEYLALLPYFISLENK